LYILPRHICFVNDFFKIFLKI